MEEDKEGVEVHWTHLEREPVEKYAVTYTYGDLLPIIMAVRDVNLLSIFKKIVREYADTLMIMAINRVINQARGNVSRRGML